MSTNIPYANLGGARGESWSPVTGCSFGCKWCWSAALAHRFKRSFKPTFHANALDQPMHWKRPRTVLVCFNGDLFGTEISDTQIAAVFGVMAACPQHTFLLLTKRPLGMASWFEWVQESRGLSNYETETCWESALEYMPRLDVRNWNVWPLPNVWLGVSVTNQADADARIPHLLKCPAAVRWVSAEPLLGDINLTPWIDYCDRRDMRGIVRTPEGKCSRCESYCGVSWVAAGAMSGPRAEPCNLDWARMLRDDCAGAGVKFCWKNPTGFPPLDGVVHDALPVVQ
jgi:protein gp37